MEIILEITDNVYNHIEIFGKNIGEKSCKYFLYINGKRAKAITEKAGGLLELLKVLNTIDKNLWT